MADIDRIKPPLPTLPPIDRGVDTPRRPPPQQHQPPPRRKPARQDDDPSSDHIDEYA